MSRRWLSRFSLFSCLLLWCATTIGQDATKWTNPDGKEIVGEFVRMDSKSVTLRLASGKETKVPLASLSLESHLQALKLAKPDNFTKEPIKALEVVEPAQLAIKRTASSVLTTPFEDDPSIDSFMQTFAKEINRANLFVVWHMMPPKMQADMSALISKGLVAAGPSAPNQLRKVFATSASIVSKKRDWILDPSVTGSPIPEEQLAEIKSAWPSFVACLTDMSDKSIWDPVNFRQENVPKFLASVMVSFQYLEPLMKSDKPLLTYNIVSQSADRAEVEMTWGPRKLPVTQFQKVGKIWVAPEIMNNIRTGLDNSAKVQMGPQVAAGFGQVMFLAIPLLTKLDEAKTKEEFKKTLDSVSNMIPKPPGGMPAGGLPGGFPGIPGFPGMGGE
jgi:hypothetical protein